MTTTRKLRAVAAKPVTPAPVSAQAGSTTMDGSTEGSVELRELQGAVQESLPAATARGNSSPAGVESGPSTLFTVSAQTQVTPAPVTLTRAANVYPDSPEMQRKWLAAIHWMRSRPQGSVWLLDRGPAKWRALPVGEVA